MNKATMTKPKPARAEIKQQTAVYLPEALRARLGRYMLEQHGGRMNVRNQIILDALDDKLKQEGY